jgi:hypothetical protein
LAGVTDAFAARGFPARPRLWVFNLDAELELAREGVNYQSPERVLRALSPLLPAAGRLMAPGDTSLDRLEPTGSREPAGAGKLGAAWCPTPSALRRLERAGAELPPCPSVSVLRRVNSRRFYLELGGGAPGARFVSDEAELDSTLRERRVWLCKRRFSFAGRGQRRIPIAPSSDDRRWLADSVRLGGILAEPWLELVSELSIHGLLDATGRVALGEVCVQQTNTYRAWVETRRPNPGEVARNDIEQLRQRATTVAEALTGAGYFGPFGIDAYVFRGPGSRLTLNPLGELNARYSMGYPIGNPQFDRE